MEMQELATHMNRGFFFHHECTTIYHSRWQSRISFYLPLTTFSFSQCERLQGIMYAALLPQMGYNRHIPKVVRHGPKHLGGAGLIHMYTEQGIKHLQHFLGTIRQSSALYDILQITFSNYQLHLGISKFFLNTEISECPHHIPGRIAFLWCFSNQHKITFQCPSIWTPSLKFKNYINLMDRITSGKGIASSSVNTFNACLEYLQILNLSEIISNNGREIRSDILYPPTIYYPKSPLQWSHQRRLSPEAWEIWRNLLSHYFCCKDSFFLCQPIGDILSPPPPFLTYRHDLRSIIATLPAANRQALQHLTFHNEAIPNLHQSLLQATSFSASDGSVLRKEGSYGYIITTRDEKWKIEGMGLVPPPTTDQYPQRAKFYGGFALASLLKAFYIWGGRKPLQLHTWIDNDAVISSNKTISRNIGLKNFLTDDYDLWEMTKLTLKDTNCKIHWNWIKGHQDRNIAYEDLPFEAQLNVQVNDLAEQAHKKLSVASDYRTLDLPVTIYINNLVASHSNLRKSIQNEAHSEDIMEYMSQKYGWTKKISKTIDWALFAYCYLKAKIHDMTNTIKYLHS